MKSRSYYIEMLRKNREILHDEFGVVSLRVFGSVARDEIREGSDVDVCVEMPPKLMMLIRLKRFLESLLDVSVDVIRFHKNINPFLKEEIERDGIYV